MLTLILDRVSLKTNFEILPGGEPSPIVVVSRIEFCALSLLKASGVEIPPSCTRVENEIYCGVVVGGFTGARVGCALGFTELTGARVGISELTGESFGRALGLTEK